MTFFYCKNWIRIFLLSLSLVPGILKAAEYPPVYGISYLGEKSTQAFSLSPCILENRFKISFNPTLLKFPHSPLCQSKIKLNFTVIENSGMSNNAFNNPINGAVGPQQYILLTENLLRSFNKKTGQPDGILNTDARSFFNFDTIIPCLKYDPFAQVWLAAAIDGLTLSSIYLAVSDSAIIKADTKWSFYQISPLQETNLLGVPSTINYVFQNMSFDRNNVYISAATVYINESLNVQGATLFSFNKKSLLRGNPQVFTVTNVLPYLGFSPNVAGDDGIYTQAADNFDSDPQYGYFCHAMNYFTPTTDFPEPYTYHNLQLYRLSQPGTENAQAIGPITLLVPSYAGPANAPHKGNVYGEEGFLQTGLPFGASALVSLHVRGHQLFACHAIQVDAMGVGTPDGDRVGVRWYQFDLTGDLSGKGQKIETSITIPVLIQYGTIYDNNPLTSAPKFYYNPSIMTNQDQDLAIGMTVSGENDYTNVAISTRCKNDIKGFLTLPLFVTSNLTNSLNTGRLVVNAGINFGQGQPLGLSSMALDFNKRNIWYSGQWAAVQNGYGVQVTKISFKKK